MFKKLKYGLFRFLKPIYTTLNPTELVSTPRENICVKPSHYLLLSECVVIRGGQIND